MIPLKDPAATVTHTDGVVVKTEVSEGGAKLGERITFPWTWELPTLTVGEHVYRVLVTDQDGATAEVTKPVTITAGNLAPAVTLTSPAEASVAAAPSALQLRECFQSGFGLNWEMFAVPTSNEVAMANSPKAGRMHFENTP